MEDREKSHSKWSSIYLINYIFFFLKYFVSVLPELYKSPLPADIDEPPPGVVGLEPADCPEAHAHDQHRRAGREPCQLAQAPRDPGQRRDEDQPRRRWCQEGRHHQRRCQDEEQRPGRAEPVVVESELPSHLLVPAHPNNSRQLYDDVRA